MNKKFFIAPLLFTLVQSGIAQEKTAPMPVNGTIKVAEGDSNEAIIQKAAHVLSQSNWIFLLLKPIFRQAPLFYPAFLIPTGQATE